MRRFREDERVRLVAPLVGGSETLSPDAPKPGWLGTVQATRYSDDSTSPFPVRVGFDLDPDKDLGWCVAQTEIEPVHEDL